jgi:hypothetical protein
VLIAAIALLVVSCGLAIAGVGVALVELVLRNYHLAAISSLTALAVSPLILIGQNMLALATPLAANG